MRKYDSEQNKLSNCGVYKDFRGTMEDFRRWDQPIDND